MFRPLFFIFLNSIAATLFGAWSAAYFFPTVAPLPLLWLIGGAIDGVGYGLVLFLAAQFFPTAFFASFSLPKAKKA